ncbi:MAG: enoyl-CoA hydratase/isomerase family protein [Syntrophomonadaceae bacterium]|jgi:enoyl-CoA hydratase|nr:enoyl-CoA hydratase/isomerase family protein [Syntrophomonadaceae bacterium]
MAYNTILVEKINADKLAVITINRPAVRNAVDYLTREELYDAVAELEGDNEVSAIILTGGSKVFSAGADISAMVEQTAHEAFNRVSLWDLATKMERSRKPIIAAIAGFALGGGCELAVACDIRIATETSQFGQTEINVGIIPGGGGLSRLTKLVGMGKAKELVYTGKIINAEEALRINLINKIVPEEKLFEEATAMAKAMTKHSPVALGLAKYAINNAANMDIHTAESIENTCFSLAFASSDQTEGMRAFLEKRKPVYQGK